MLQQLSHTRVLSGLLHTRFDDFDPPMEVRVLHLSATTVKAQRANLAMDSWMAFPVLERTRWATCRLRQMRGQA